MSTLYTAPLAIKKTTDIRAMGVRPHQQNSSVAAAHYEIVVDGYVDDVAITAPNSLLYGYQQTSNAAGAQFWNGEGNARFTLQSTSGDTLRYSIATGADLPDAPDVDCTMACDGDDACTECTPGAGSCLTRLVTPLTTIKAVGCKPRYMPSDIRRVVFADPRYSIVLRPIARYGQSTIALATATEGATLCYTMGIGNVVDPTCSPTTGACTTIGPLPSGVLAGTYDDASELSRPHLTAKGTTVRAPRL
jgi:hypothetical protein